MGVNTRGSSSPSGDDGLHQHATEFELHANSSCQSFLSFESRECDSDAWQKCRVRANLSKRLESKELDTPNAGAGDAAVKETSVTVPKTTVLPDTQGQNLFNLQAFISLAQQLQAGSMSHHTLTWNL